MQGTAAPEGLHFRYPCMAVLADLCSLPQTLRSTAAQSIYESMAFAFVKEPERWASTAPAHVLGRVVPYSLRQLSEWLASGSMARGAPTRHARMFSGALH